MRYLKNIEGLIIFNQKDLKKGMVDVPYNYLEYWHFNSKNINQELKKAELVIFVDGEFTKVLLSRHF